MLATLLASNVIPQVGSYVTPPCRTFILPALEVPILVLCTRLPGDVEDWKVDFTNRLCTGDEIMGATIDVIAGDVTIDQIQTDAISVSFFISGGRGFYTSVIRITAQGSTSPNRTYDVDLAIRTL